MLPFEDPDPRFIPLAGRRALDLAGRKLALRAWQGLSLPVRESLVALGDGDEVDVDRVRALLADADPPPAVIEPRPDPLADTLPEGLAAALAPERPIDGATWRALRPVERYALAHFLRPERLDTLRRAYDALLG